MSLSINGPPQGLTSLMVSRAELGGDSTDQNEGLRPETHPHRQVPHAPADDRRAETDTDDAQPSVIVDLELAVEQRSSFELRHTTIDITEDGTVPSTDSLAIVVDEGKHGVDFDGDGQVTVADAAYGRLPQWDGSRQQTLAMTSAMAVELARQAYARLDE